MIPDGALHGFCARTRLPAPVSSESVGDCDRDPSGARWIQQGASSAWSMCAAWCTACSRCRFVSLSFGPDHNSSQLCAWHVHCNLDDLRTFAGETLAGANWSTMQLKTRVPLHLPRADADTRGSKGSIHLAITTLAFTLHHANARRNPFVRGCALDGWCQGAARLRRILENPWRVTILILHGLADSSGPQSTETAVMSSGSCAQAEIATIPASGVLSRLAHQCLDHLRSTSRYFTGMSL